MVLDPARRGRQPAHPGHAPTLGTPHPAAKKPAGSSGSRRPNPASRSARCRCSSSHRTIAYVGASPRATSRATHSRTTIWPVFDPPPLRGHPPGPRRAAGGRRRARAGGLGAPPRGAPLSCSRTRSTARAARPGTARTPTSTPGGRLPSTPGGTRSGRAGSGARRSFAAARGGGGGRGRSPRRRGAGPGRPRAPCHARVRRPRRRRSPIGGPHHPHGARPRPARRA